MMGSVQGHETVDPTRNRYVSLLAELSFRQKSILEHLFSPCDASIFALTSLEIFIGILTVVGICYHALAREYSFPTDNRCSSCVCQYLESSLV